MIYRGEYRAHHQAHFDAARNNIPAQRQLTQSMAVIELLMRAPSQIDDNFPARETRPGLAQDYGMLALRLRQHVITVFHLSRQQFAFADAA